MQAFFLPMMAIAFAASPIAGQNFGARNHDRGRETLISAMLISSVLMGVVTLLCQWNPQPQIRFFSRDPGWSASAAPGFKGEEVWYLSVATVALQAATSLALVYRQMHRARQPALA